MYNTHVMHVDGPEIRYLFLATKAVDPLDQRAHRVLTLRGLLHRRHHNHRVSPHL